MRLTVRKAAGNCGIMPEVLKAGGDVAAERLVKVSIRCGEWVWLLVIVRV